jgi:UDP-sugar diphosphatase
VLKKVDILNVTPNDAPQFIKTKLVEAKRDGKLFYWEVAEAHDSVHVLVDNVEKREVLLVRQIRVPVLVNNPNTDGSVYEACAGIVDKDCSIEQIAKEEVLEELGYDVDVEALKKVRTYKSSVGTQGSTCYSFKVEVDESEHVSEGGGLPSEDIEVVGVPYEEVIDLINGYDKYKDSNIDSTTLFLLMDWIYNKKD